jgi:hypothetical protein
MLIALIFSHSLNTNLMQVMAYRVFVEPPAASIFSEAEEEKAWA